MEAQSGQSTFPAVLNRVLATPSFCCSKGPEFKKAESQFQMLIPEGSCPFLARILHCLMSTISLTVLCNAGHTAAFQPRIWTLRLHR